MKNYTIFKLSNAWSSDKLRQEADSLVNEKARDGYEIVSEALELIIGGFQPFL